MWLLQILPAVEVLIFNSISMDACFKRKYSRTVTALVLAAAAIGMFACGFAFSEFLNYQGDGRMMLIGFIYLPLLYFLYQARLFRTLYSHVFLLGIYSEHSFPCLSVLISMVFRQFSPQPAHRNLSFSRNLPSLLPPGCTEICFRPEKLTLFQ